MTACIAVFVDRKFTNILCGRFTSASDVMAATHQASCVWRARIAD